MPILNNTKEERFVQFFCVGMSKTAAYVKTGYKKSRKEPSRLGAKPHIKARIAELMRGSAKLTG